MDVTQQLLTVGAVLAGALLSFVGSGINDRFRFRRDKAAKLIEQRSAAYAGYGRAIKACYSLSSRIAAGRGLHAQTPSLSPEDGLPQLEAAAAQRERDWEHVLLLGDPATVEAARTWHRSVWRMEWYAHGWIDEADPAGWEEAVATASRSRTKFYAAARRSLDIPSPRLEDGIWPIEWMMKRKPSTTEAPPRITE
ncbi:hypothetical protein [Micromonospora aurantiaca (nom. illeg.)]|uniref:hypothetical protein n=1 Tax=Micromonospora aurantiaca (nom. illeg.) TaxID=47850 RepID=UPI003EC0280F